MTSANAEKLKNKLSKMKHKINQNEYDNLLEEEKEFYVEEIIMNESGNFEGTGNYIYMTNEEFEDYQDNEK